jgi:hypothetical protein
MYFVDKICLTKEAFIIKESMCSTILLENLMIAQLSETFTAFNVTRRIIGIVTCMSDYGRGFGLEIGFIDHFNKRIVATFIFSAIANLNTLHITRAHAKSFRALSVFISSCLVTALTMVIPLLPYSSPL